MEKFGIDVSRWQGDFDFAKAKKEGVKFAIIKAGGADGGLYKDSKFEQNYKNAKAAKIGVGAYFFGSAKTINEAQAEAAYFAELIKGKQFDYPVFYDVEADEMKVGKDALTDIVWEFCAEMEKRGYWCGFYTNLDWYINHLNGAGLAARFSFWCAAWMKSCPREDAQMWQFGGSTNLIRENTVAGVVCDQDYCFVDYPKKIKEKGLNGYGKTEVKTEWAKDDKIKLTSDAVIYGTRAKFAPFVYGNKYYIREINGDRVVFAPAKTGAITGAVSTKYITKA